MSSTRREGSWMRAKSLVSPLAQKTREACSKEGRTGWVLVVVVVVEGREYCNEG
jgi:hypothetical protein